MSLLPCPHCGEQPSFGHIEEMDERRYVQLDLNCCSTLHATIGWPKFNQMTEAQQVVQLQAELTCDWNKRCQMPGTLSAVQLEGLIATFDGVYIEDAVLDVGTLLRQHLSKILEDQ